MLTNKVAALELEIVLSVFAGSVIKDLLNELALCLLLLCACWLTSFGAAWVSRASLLGCRSQVIKLGMEGQPFETMLALFGPSFEEPSMGTFLWSLHQISKGLLLALLFLRSQRFASFSGLVHEVILVVQDVLHPLDGKWCNALVLLILLLQKGLLLEWPQGQRNLSGGLRGIMEPVLQSHVPGWHLPDLLHGDAEGLDLLPLLWRDQAAQVMKDVVHASLAPMLPRLWRRDMELHWVLKLM